MSRARPVTFPQRPLEEGKSLEALQSVQDRFRGVSPRSDSKFRFRQGTFFIFLRLFLPFQTRGGFESVPPTGLSGS